MKRDKRSRGGREKSKKKEKWGCNGMELREIMEEWILDVN